MRAVVLALSGLGATDATAEPSVTTHADDTDPLEPDARDPHHGRSLVQMGIGLGALTLGYWTLQLQTNKQDWDFPPVEDRFNGSAWRFDNNQLIINYWMHPLAGAEMYAAARANHHDVWTSAAYSTLSSFLWEFGFEYRELVSVNDLVATSFPGVPIGEFLHKLGVYLASARNPGPGTQALQWTLSAPVQYDRWADGLPAPEVPHRDSLGLDSRIWHDFEFVGTAGASGEPNQDQVSYFATEFRGRLVSLPGFRQPRKFGKFFHRAEVSSMRFGGEGSKHGAGLTMAADTMLVGYHVQDLWASPHGGRKPSLNGTTATFGASMAYSYLETQANGFRERFGAFHMPGPAVLASAHSPLGAVDLSARVSPDFVGVGAFGYDEWQERHPGELGKHILRNQGYFYGWGASGAIEARLQLGPLSFDGDVFFGQYRSQEGLNRWQERITLDVPAATDLLQYRAAMRLRPGNLPLEVGATLVRRRWESSIGEIDRAETALLRGVQLGLRF